MEKIVNIPHEVKGYEADGTPIVDFPNDALALLMAASPEEHQRIRDAMNEKLKEVSKILADGGVKAESRKDTVYALLGCLFMLYSDEVSDFLKDAGYRFVRAED